VIWAGWRCQRCRHEMRHNQRCCPSCGYTVFDPIQAEERPDWAVLKLDELDRLGYLAPSGEWTDLTEPLPEVFQHAADELLAEGALSERFNDFRKGPRS